eukprot:778468-Rhodomonas_salina.2
MLLLTSAMLLPGANGFSPRSHDPFVSAVRYAATHCPVLAQHMVLCMPYCHSAPILPLPTPYSLDPAPYSLLPAPHQHLTPNTLNPMPYNLS